MGIETLTALPAEIVAGETVIVQFSPAGFSASDGWALSVAFDGPEQFTLNADADQLLTIATADTDTREGGTYNWNAYVQKAGQRKFVLTGNVYIRPNPLIDATTWAAECLEQLRAQILNRLPRGIESHTINGTQIAKMSIAQAVELEGKFASRVAAEMRAKLAAGDGDDDRILIEFDR